MPDVDTVLIASCVRGDEDAFAALYDLYAPRVYGVIRRVLRDPRLSEEVAQEVFVEAWRTAPRYDSARGTVATWFTTMAHHRAVDRVRSEQAARDREIRVAVRDVERPVDVVAEQVEAGLEREHVRRALAGLSFLQRQAIELAYDGGYTYREVAQMLDAPLGTVKSRIREGLIELRVRMTDDVAPPHRRSAPPPSWSGPLPRPAGAAWPAPNHRQEIDQWHPTRSRPAGDTSDGHRTGRAGPAVGWDEAAGRSTPA